MSLCARPWCQVENPLQLGEHVVTEHSAVIECIALGRSVLTVRIVDMDGDQEPVVVVENVVENASPSSDTTEVMSMSLSTGQRLGSGLTRAYDAATTRLPLRLVHSSSGESAARR